MGMEPDKKVCIIGPSPDSPYQGGVATHISTLKTLACFKDAEVIDPGSIHSNNKTGIVSIFRSLTGLKQRILLGRFTHVFVNTSIYTGSIIKLLLILAILPNADNTKIHVFYHGGRFQSLPAWLSVLLSTLCLRLMHKVRMHHFLSKIQQEGFVPVCKGCSVGLFANYAQGDDIWLRHLKSQNAPLKLLFVGRLVKEKGIFEALEAFNRLHGADGQVELTVAGDGPAYPELSTMCKYISDGALRFLGHVSGETLEQAYREADLLVIPSYHEAFPYAAIEAMRAGLPMISTSSGALEMLVEDGVTGFKIPPRDVSALEKAIRTILENRELLKPMSDNCYEYFKAHLSKSAAEQYYSRLLGTCTVA
ncbi:glycosyltransferase [Geobacter metallireducens GS-15]|uniref:Glycosyltransferase n=2 Tax=Geobacteraceae TaxID=213422 RepID=Q39VJ1_GEOMG|nr:glycosyltransferase family 4 protein [Geobacter metallireducens]ABB31733.1 glycosyltransferase [Geobacter metallireducens GS-15]